MRTLLTIFFLCTIFFPQQLLSQGEGNNWYFGFNAGLNFETSPPTVLTNSAIGTNEGCASISNPEGQLLFYTDGLTVYNANHLTMANGTGLLGGSSSSQSAIIVAAPGNPNLYYIFTVVEEGFGGLSYSVVDMQGDGGLGAVTAQKNISLLDFSSEKVTAVRHNNGADIWIVSTSNTTNTFYSFLLSSTGVNTTPVASTAGTQPLPIGIGYLKASFDGQYLVCAHSLKPGDNLDILSFDNSNGEVSDLFSLTCDPVTPYGIEFSPDQSKLYIGAIDEQQTFGELLQFDLTSMNEATIQASKTSLFNSTLNGYYIGAVQIAPDGLLYVATTSGALGVIQSPNALGLACDFDPQAIDLSPSGFSTFGLPNFFPNFFSEPDIFAEQFCFGIPTLFTIDGLQEGATAAWDFGDPDAPTNTAEGEVVSHLFSQGGTFNVMCTITFEDEEFIYEIEVTIIQPSLEIVANPGTVGLAPFEVDFTFLGNVGSIELDVESDQDFDFLLESINDTATYVYFTPGEFLAFASASIGECVIQDSILIRVFTEPALFIPDVITPNGDALNNSFLVRGTGIKRFELLIYNRWGTLLGTINDVDDVFDATDRFDTWRPDDREPSGVYVYVYNALGENGSALNGEGTITVLGLE